MSLRMASGSKTVSPSIMTTMSKWAQARPVLRALALPALGWRTTITRGSGMPVGDFVRTVAGPVVHHDDLDVLMGGREQRTYGRLDARLLVVRGDDHRDRIGDLAQPGRAGPEALSAAGHGHGRRRRAGPAAARPAPPATAAPRSCPRRTRARGPWSQNRALPCHRSAVDTGVSAEGRPSPAVTVVNLSTFRSPSSRFAVAVGDSFWLNCRTTPCDGLRNHRSAATSM